MLVPQFFIQLVEGFYGLLMYVHLVGLILVVY
jgi:hypothetical protein